MNIKELSKYLNVSKRTIYSWASMKRIPHLKIGGTLRFDVREIESWLEEKKVEVSNIHREQIVK